MKKYFLTIAILFVTIIAFAQSGKNPPAKEKPPTQKEINDMMDEMQAAMDDISPEDKKAMDSVGIKMPDMKSLQKTVAGISDAQLKKAYEDENRIVPLKDNARIALIPKTMLTAAALPAYLQSVHAQVMNKLGTSITLPGENIFQWLKNKYQTSAALGNAAVGCWIMGKPGIALFIMSKICKDDPTNTDNLNNLSAFLTMAGAEQLAIPILDNLNKRFPKNSTILNNLGQAWFGLGETGKAEKYVDSTIRLCASHSQANLTKSFIEESKGNMQASIQAVKRSIKNAYSPEKENRLDKSGYKLESEDLDWDRPMPQDPLGLEKFNWPDYPMNTKQCEMLEKKWNAFKESCQKEIYELNGQLKNLEAIAGSANQQRVQELLNAGSKGLMVDPIPRFAQKASIKLKHLLVALNMQQADLYEKKIKALATAYAEADIFDDILANQLEVLRKKYEDKFGEGKLNPFQAACADDREAKDIFLNRSNSLLDSKSSDYLNFLRRKLNDETYYYQYTMWPEDFELAKIQAKLTWLNSIKDQRPMFKKESGWCQANEEKAKPEPFKLQKFEDVHCDYHSELNLLIGSINNDCSKMTAKLNLEFVKLGWKMKQGDKDGESLMDQFVSCTVEVGYKKGVSVGAGPLKLEAKAGAAVVVEIGKAGVTDIAVKVGADIKVGTDIIKDNKVGPIKDQSISIIGAEATISVNTGPSVELKGLLNRQ